jgi:hypothetical protein
LYIMSTQYTVNDLKVQEFVRRNIQILKLFSIST